MLNVEYPTKKNLNLVSFNVSDQQWTESFPLSLATLSRIIKAYNNEKYEILISHGSDDKIPLL